MKRESEYFEVSRPSGKGECSDNTCPCTDPQSTIERGKGYLFVSHEVAQFRSDARTELEAAKKIARMEVNLNSGFANPNDIASPILMCRMAAKKRGLALDVAAADARQWWSTGTVALRATPIHSSRATKGRGNDTTPPRTVVPSEKHEHKNHDMSQAERERLVSIATRMNAAGISREECDQVLTDLGCAVISGSRGIEKAGLGEVSRVLLHSAKVVMNTFLSSTDRDPTIKVNWRVHDILVRHGSVEAVRTSCRCIRQMIRIVREYKERNTWFESIDMADTWFLAWVGKAWPIMLVQFLAAFATRLAMKPHGVFSISGLSDEWVAAIVGIQLLVGVLMWGALFFRTVPGEWENGIAFTVCAFGPGLCGVLFGYAAMAWIC